MGLLCSSQQRSAIPIASQDSSRMLPHTTNTCPLRGAAEGVGVVGVVGVGGVRLVEGVVGVVVDTEGVGCCICGVVGA